MSKEKYECTNLEIVRFEMTDVIMASDPDRYELEREMIQLSLK